MATPPKLDDLRDEYLQLFADCEITRDREADVKQVMDKIVSNQVWYVLNTAAIPMPWWVLGLLHARESDLNFHEHLHNGDPLTGRTVHEPAGRPAANPGGGPDPPSRTNPYTWGESTQDAIRMHGLHTWTDWDLAGTLFKLEEYNGWGYRMYHADVLSPYLWSFTNHYTKGKYSDDGNFDPDLVDRQAGAAAVLRMMVTTGTVPATSVPDLVVFNAKRLAIQALQSMAMINAGPLRMLR